MFINILQKIGKKQKMSYEGYSQFWCKNGHYWKIDCEELPNLMYEEDKKQKCPVCGEEEVFENMVNITNGSFDDDGIRIDGYMDPELIESHKSKCENCGKEHLCECALYKIPIKK